MEFGDAMPTPTGWLGMNEESYIIFYTLCAVLIDCSLLDGAGGPTLTGLYAWSPKVLFNNILYFYLKNNY